MDETTWYTKERMTVRNIMAIVTRLERGGADLMDEIRIVVVGDGGLILPDGRRFTDRTLPPEGVIVVGRSVG